MTKVASECTLEVGGNSYTLNKPTIGQIIEIQTMKAQLTRGAYGQIVRNMDQLGVMSLDIVDMIAVINLLCPEVLKDLKVKSWDDLDPFDMLDIFKGYSEKVLPWYRQYTEGIVEVWNGITDSLIDKKSQDANSAK